MIQMGLIDGEGIYRMSRDMGRAWGGDPDQYLRPPSPHAAKVKILAEEAVQSMLKSQMPDGYPAEHGGPREHMEKLLEFMQEDHFGLLQAEQVDLFRKWLETVRRYVAEQMQQERMMQAAAMMQQMLGGQGMGSEGGRPPEQVEAPQGNPTVSGGGELMDESLPGAKGGTVT